MLCVIIAGHVIRVIVFRIKVLSACRHLLEYCLVLLFSVTLVILDCLCLLLEQLLLLLIYPYASSRTPAILSNYHKKIGLPQQLEQPGFHPSFPARMPASMRQTTPVTGSPLLWALNRAFSFAAAFASSESAFHCSGCRFFCPFFCLLRRFLSHHHRVHAIIILARLIMLQSQSFSASHTL